jgi:cysteinyl-tRNA synthetase
MMRFNFYAIATLSMLLFSLESAASFVLLHHGQTSTSTSTSTRTTTRSYDQPRQQLSFAVTMTPLKTSGDDYQSEYSADQIKELLADRLQAKQSGDYDMADKIQIELRNAGVSVPNSDGGGSNDNERRTDTSRRYRGSDDTSRRRNSDATTSPRRPVAAPRRQKRFGPNGHDYLPSPDAGPIRSEYSESDIHALLAERLQAKMQRDFFTADKIQDELRGAGVSIHDGLKEWRADGIRIEADNKVKLGDAAGRNGRNSQSRGAAAPRKDNRNRAYTQSEYSDEISANDVQQIQELVAERLGAKQARDFHTADDIRDELRGNWNVLIEDRLRQWAVGGDFGPEHAAISGAEQKKDGYVRSVHSWTVDEHEDYILNQIEKRSQAKKNRNYAISDAIRDELIKDYDVHINDRLMEWSRGGDFGESTGRESRDYVRRGGGDLSPDEVFAVQSMIKMRVQAKKARNFDKADGIRDELRFAYNVSVDDTTLEWRVMSDDYALSTVSGGDAAALLDVQTIAYVQQRLTKRVHAKESKDFGLADDIRDELRDSYGVEVDDKRREWYIETSNQYDDAFENQDNRRPAPPSIQFDGQDDEQDWKNDDYNKENKLALEEVEQEDASNGATTSADLSSLTVVELKYRLKDAGMKVSGKKSELIERLTEMV